MTIDDIVGQFFYDPEIDRDFQARWKQTNEDIIQESHGYGDTPEYGPALTQKEINALRNEKHDRLTIKVFSTFKDDGILWLDTSYGEIPAKDFLEKIKSGAVFPVSCPED